MSPLNRGLHLSFKVKNTGGGGASFFKYRHSLLLCRIMKFPSKVLKKALNFQYKDTCYKISTKSFISMTSRTLNFF